MRSRGVTLASAIVALALAIPAAAADPAASSASDPKESIAALVALRGKGPTAIEAFKKALRDPRPPVRAAAIDLLAREAGPSAASDLVALAGDSDQGVQMAALRAIVGWPGDSVATAVRKALQSVSPEVRAQTAGYIGDRKDRQYLRDVAALVSDPTTSVRVTAVSTLRALGGPEVFPFLMAATSDADGAVVRAAVSGLEGLRDSRAAERLVRLAGSEIVDIRATVAPALLAVGGASSQPDAVKKLLADPSPVVRVALLSGAKKYATAETAALVAPALKDSDPEVRRAAVGALRSAPSSSAAAPLQAAVKDENETVRVAAVLALGERGDRAAWPSVSPVVGDPSAPVRLAAMDAAGRLGDPDALPAIAGRAKDSDASVRARAAWAAGKIGGAAALPILDTFLADPSEPVRLESLRSLGAHSDPKALGRVRKVAETGPAALRIEAIQILGVRKDTSASALLRKCLQDPSESVRAAARRALDAIGAPAPS